MGGRDVLTVKVIGGVVLGGDILTVEVGGGDVSTVELDKEVVVNGRDIWIMSLEYSAEVTYCLKLTEGTC